MTDNQKIHEILKFICSPQFANKASFNSDELTKAINPEISLSEANVLCRILISEGDVLDVSSFDNHGTVGIARMTEAEDAYHTQKYLKLDHESENDIEFNISNSNVNFGTVSERQNITTNQKEGSKPNKWVKIFLAIVLPVISGYILWMITTDSNSSSNDSSTPPKENISMSPISVTFKNDIRAEVYFSAQLVIIDSLLLRTAQTFGDAKRASEFLTMRIKNEVIQNLERMTIDSARNNRQIIENQIIKETLNDQIKGGYSIYALNLNEIKISE